MVLRFPSLEVERTRRMEGNRGRSPPYIDGNPSIAFAARLIPQYESHIRITKETIQFVVNLTKEIPHGNRVTKERTPKLSQHVSHQGTVRGRSLQGCENGRKNPKRQCGRRGNQQRQQQGIHSREQPRSRNKPSRQRQMYASQGQKQCVEPHRRSPNSRFCNLPHERFEDHGSLHPAQPKKNH